MLRRLWEKCWEDGIQTWSVEPEMAYDPSKFNKITYDGTFYHLIYVTPFIKID
jgi:hypothetical protein